MAVPKSVGRWDRAACGSAGAVLSHAQGSSLQSYFFFFFFFF